MSLIKKRVLPFVVLLLLLLILEMKAVNARSETYEEEWEKRNEEIKKMSMSLNKVFVSVGHAPGYDAYYDDDQPIQLYVEITVGSEVVIGRNDWYNMLDISSTINRVPNLQIKEERKKVNYKVLKGDDLVNGAIKPNEVKSAIVAVLDEENKPFQSGLVYNIYVQLLPFKGGISISSSRDIYIKKVPTYPEADSESKRLYNITKGHIAESKGNYALAAEYFLKAFEVEKDIMKKDNNFPYYDLLWATINFYEKAKDYNNARKYAEILIKYTVDEIKYNEEERHKKHESLVKEKGKIVSYEEFSEKEDARIYNFQRQTNAIIDPKSWQKIMTDKVKKYNELILKEGEKK